MIYKLNFRNWTIWMSSTGILRDIEIMGEIRAGRLLKNASEDCVQTCSYDMRIGTIFEGENIIRNSQTGGKQVVISPGEIISLFTLEDIFLPPDIAATAFAMNSWSSQGILVLNPGHVDPGYEGPLTVRVINLRATPKAIPLGIPIFTVIFERLPAEVEKPYGKNKPRSLAELEFHATDIEQNPRTLINLIKHGDEKPLMTERDVNKLIVEHWTSKVVTAGSIIAALFAVIATFVTMILAFKPSSSSPSPSPEVSLVAQQPRPTPGPSVAATNDTAMASPTAPLPVRSPEAPSPTPSIISPIQSPREVPAPTRSATPTNSQQP